MEDSKTICSELKGKLKRQLRKNVNIDRKLRSVDGKYENFG